MDIPQSLTRVAGPTLDLRLPSKTQSTVAVIWLVLILRPTGGRRVSLPEMWLVVNDPIAYLNIYITGKRYGSDT